MRQILFYTERELLMTLKKAVIPAAGLGTRFLPATKTVPKELLPIVDKPILLYVVEEAIQAGIEDIIIIAGRNKSAIEDFFDRSYELEDTLYKTGKTELLGLVKEIQEMVQVISIRQKEAKGLGHAVYTAKPVVGDQPFAVLLGDEIMISDDQDSVTSQLNKKYQATGCSTVAVMEVAQEDVHKYGIVAVENSSDEAMRVLSVVEKPNQGEAPSRLALPGRYIFNASLFDFLENLPPGKNGEIQLTDAMTAEAQGPGLYATRFVAQRYDAGDKFGYLQANIEMGLKHPQVGESLRQYLKTLSL
jgi:UTP--glucose-1-phosphate uridylyltransferase